MNLQSYGDYFHDGGLIAITNNHGALQISMESAALDPDENVDHIPLSPQSTLKGKLHVSEIESIKKDGEAIAQLIQEYDKGVIMDLVISDKYICLQLWWENFPFKEHTDLITYEIKAKNIFWENIPDLHDPWW